MPRMQVVELADAQGEGRSELQIDACAERNSRAANFTELNVLGLIGEAKSLALQSRFGFQCRFFRHIDPFVGKLPATKQ